MEIFNRTILEYSSEELAVRCRDLVLYLNVVDGQKRNQEEVVEEYLVQVSEAEEYYFSNDLEQIIRTNFKYNFMSDLEIKMYCKYVLRKIKMRPVWKKGEYAELLEEVDKYNMDVELEGIAELRDIFVESNRGHDMVEVMVQYFHNFQEVIRIDRDYIMCTIKFYLVHDAPYEEPKKN